MSLPRGGIISAHREKSSNRGRNEEGRWKREGDRKMVAVGEITAQILSITIIHTSHGDV